jgi:N6-adenosine-specific RNA methylase IME4
MVSVVPMNGLPDQAVCARYSTAPTCSCLASCRCGAICRLPVGEIAAPDAVLALWVYGPRLPDALRVMDAWGFEFKSDLITWLKVTANGEPAFGTGYYTRKNTEQLLLGTRGNGLKVLDHSVRQSIIAATRGESVKPDEAYEALGRLFGPVRRLEMFARRSRPAGIRGATKPGV